jgi:serine/threonine protein kinase
MSEGDELESTATTGAGSLTPSQELGSLESVLVALARTDAPALAPGTLIAEQYRIVRSIGKGGMGEVLLAHDLRLDRDVAVKVCTGLSRAVVQRMQREAMALAKLAHPNVVVVFQAGEIDGRFFIVMEHVAGGTARSWLADAPRRPAEILALYLDAGAGLAAAHAAGLVHRDFKPDNVLVGLDGRPRVADFGLVRAAREREPIDGGDSGASPSGASLLTRAGTVMGTPAYMPPEQLAGDELDARADQYAFAASLWEALMGWRPSAGGTRSDGALAAELTTSVGTSGTDRPHTEHEVEHEIPRNVPRHVVAALRRALAERPDDRWPDLDALLLALRRDPVKERRVLLGAASGLIALGTWIAIAMWPEPPPPPPCEDGPAKIEAVWNAERSDALAAAVGEEAWPAIETRARARADEWVDAYAQACRATKVDETADEITFHHRMLCLDARLDELDTMLEALKEGSPTAIGNAALAIDRLPASEACLDAGTRAGEAPLPSDPVQREEIAKVQRAVAEAEAAVIDPALLDAAGKADRAVTMARATNWAPVLAHALNVRGVLAFQDDRNELALSSYEEAMYLALSSGHDALAVHSLARLGRTLGQLRRIDEAERVLASGRALWERIGRPTYEERLLLGAEGHVARYDNRPLDALAKTRAQIALTEPGAPALIVADDAFNLSLGLMEAGELEAAMPLAMEAVAKAREALGDGHPSVAEFQAHAASIAGARGDYDAAVELGEAALATFDQWYGPTSLRAVPVISALANATRRQGRLDDAMKLYQRELALDDHRDPEVRKRPMLEANMAIVMVEQGDLAGAAPMAAQALASLERVYGPDDRALVQALVLTGYIARERPEPDFAASTRDLERALTIGRATFGPTHPETINVEIELANTLVAKGEAATAVERLEAWVPRLAELDLPLHQPAELRYTLARALAATGRTARACKLAGEAEETLRGLVLDHEPVAQWKARHCPAASAGE